MNSHIKKIRAFTLNEMIVVLLITSLVVGMAFSVLRLVQLQMHGISENFEKNTEINLFRQSLWLDFNRYNSVWYDASKHRLLFSNEMKTAAYRFHEGFVTKARDTFHIKIIDRFRYFNGDVKFSGEIDALDLYTAKDDGGKRIFVFKRNAATSYLNEKDGF